MKSVIEGLAKQGQLPVDNIHAKLTANEYVIPADVVVAIGHGDAKAGIAKLDQMVQMIRQKTQGMLSTMNKQQG